MKGVSAPKLALIATGMAAATTAWLLAFPRLPGGIEWADIVMEASYLAAAGAVYPSIARLRVRMLEAGWLLFGLSLHLEILDEFTLESELWNTYFTGGLGIIALLLAGLGFRESVRIRRRERARRRRAERTKEDLLSIVAHDFRSPLTVIQGYAELLAERAREEETRQMLDAMVGQTRYLARLASDLLTLSRIESGRLAVERRPVRLAELLRSVAEARQAAGVELQLEADDALTVDGDPDRLRQVVDNLVANAIKYSAAPARVRLRAAQDGREAQVSVGDQGIGIAPEDLPRLFRRFSRLKAARERGIEGTGLGLFICRSLVEAHGGRVWVESTPGKGSTFGFALPLQAEPVRDREKAL
jgi:signal transduction histidine kinase